jgi:hypothetical protein
VKALRVKCSVSFPGGDRRAQSMSYFQLVPIGLLFTR